MARLRSEKSTGKRMFLNDMDDSLVPICAVDAPLLESIGGRRYPFCIGLVRHVRPERVRGCRHTPLRERTQTPGEFPQSCVKGQAANARRSPFKMKTRIRGSIPLPGWGVR